MKRIRFGLIFHYLPDRTVHITRTFFFNHQNPFYIHWFTFVVPCVEVDKDGLRFIH